MIDNMNITIKNVLKHIRKIMVPLFCTVIAIENKTNLEKVRLNDLDEEQLLIRPFMTVDYTRLINMKSLLGIKPVIITHPNILRRDAEKAWLELRKYTVQENTTHLADDTLAKIKQYMIGLCKQTMYNSEGKKIQIMTRYEMLTTNKKKLNWFTEWILQV